MSTDNNKNYRVEICGGIASGKTTLATLLGEQGLHTVFENFQSSPFLEAFYLSPQRYSFETEVTFLLQHYHQIKITNPKSSSFICDYSLYLDIAYATVTLTRTQLKAFKAVYQEIRSEIYIPKLLIKLECSAEVELKRIHNRKRSFEQNIKVDFLQNLNQAIDNTVKNFGRETSVININSEKLDFASNKEDKDFVISVINEKLSNFIDAY